jgi:hypothetical protein
MSVIHLAKQALNGLFASAAFIARGITNYTVASPSDLTIFGKPTNKQLAFDGYCSNIEAFICATSIKRKVLCDLSHYPIDGSHIVTVPIPLPRTVFALKDKSSEAAEKRMLEAGKEMGLEKVEVGKGHVYTVERPTLDFLVKIRRASHDNCTNLTDYSQLGATIQFYWVLQCVDLFLATNTYSYKPELFGQDKGSDDPHPHVDVEYTGGAVWAHGCTDKKPFKKRKLEAGWTTTEIPDIDEARSHDTQITSTYAAVFVAKPSPLPSSTSWGTPSECPNSKGIHFPYFEGLNHSDVNFMRSMVSRHFFRNLGSVAKTPKDAFLEFRTQIGPAASTPSGRILNHVLYGIDLALGTQTQLYLLIEDGRYYGFNLLGGYFSIWANGWKESASEEELKAEMDKYQSHETALAALTSSYRTLGVKWVPGFKMPNESMKTSQHVLAALGAIDQEATSSDAMDAIEKSLRGLSFPGLYRKMNAANLGDAVDELLGHNPFPKKQSVYVPVARSAWKAVASPYAGVLCSFGARSFSLIDRGGKAQPVLLSSTIFKETLDSKDKVEKVRTTLPFFEKPFHECIADWGTVVQTGKAKVNFMERAIGSRGFLVRGEDMASIIESFDKAKEEKKIGLGVPKEDKKGKKKAGDVVMGEIVTLDDLF